MLSRTDIEATLRALLFHFLSSREQGTAEIGRFASAGAEALLLQIQPELRGGAHQRRQQRQRYQRRGAGGGASGGGGGTAG